MTAYLYDTGGNWVAHVPDGRNVWSRHGKWIGWFAYGDADVITPRASTSARSWATASCTTRRIRTAATLAIRGIPATLGIQAIPATPATRGLSRGHETSARRTTTRAHL